MNAKYLALCFVLVSPALAQNKPGVTVEGAVTLGDCVKFGSSANRIADAGGPCATAPQQQLSIGQTVVGATPGMCLTVDANGKLAQANCLLAE